MLETVKRISNISKCRDLINFELLLYMTDWISSVIFLFLLLNKSLRICKRKSYMIWKRAGLYSRVHVCGGIRPKLLSI